MNRLGLYFLALLQTLIICSCNNNGDEPTPEPIRFANQEYSIRLGVGTNISFVDGGGVYELSASNPEILGKYSIEVETKNLLINPAATGQSYLTIKDVIAGSLVTLNITVEDFYMSFRIDEIEGKNTNEYFDIGREIRFVRDADNTKPILIMRQNKLDYHWLTVGEGVFDISRSETEIFSMHMALHGNHNEELVAFEYTMSGDAGYMYIFDHWFGYNWPQATMSGRTLPVERCRMILTDTFNGCKITCTLQPFR